MTTDPTGAGAIATRGAEWLAGVESLPTSLRAVLGYYADTGVFDYAALAVKREVDDVTAVFVADAYAAVDEAVAREFDRDPDAVGFDYDTKLTMPAELTLGYVYQRAREATPGDVDPVTGTARSPTGRLRRWFGRDEAGATPASRRRTEGEVPGEAAEDVRAAEGMTELVIEALLDGDMRDALNDDEYEDFEVSFAVDEPTRRHVAELAQRTIERRVMARFEAYPPAVRAAYDRAVERSDAHQRRDPTFREIARIAAESAPGADRRIREEYRDVGFEEPPAMFSDEELDLPYLRTQYNRVGVIYDGMIDMYRAVGLDIPPEFEKAIVLAIIGAQIWLDDVDDFHRDVADEQLTPVTAEYWLADDDRAAYERVVDLARAYLAAAKRAATAVDSTLTGVAIEYIARSGTPKDLPGSHDT